MKRLWWWCGAVLGVAVVVAGSLVATGFPGRSDFLARQQPGACRLITGGAAPGTTVQTAPYGAITSCLVLGRRTDLSAAPDGAVFVLAETDHGVVALRIDYRGTGAGFTADAVEVPQYRAPGISGDTANRIKDAVNQRGGLHTAPWQVHPAQS